MLTTVSLVHHVLDLARVWDEQGFSIQEHPTCIAIIPRTTNGGRFPASS